MWRPFKHNLANLLHICGSSPKMLVQVLRIGLFGVALVFLSIPFLLLLGYQIGAEPPPSDVIIPLASKRSPNRAAYASFLVESDVAPRVLSTLEILRSRLIFSNDLFAILAGLLAFFVLTAVLFGLWMFRRTAREMLQEA